MNPFESFDIRNLSNKFTGKANFKPFGKGNGCKLCGREDPACRYNANEPDFIQCHHFADARKGEKVNGFVCVKESNGHTASFKPDNSQEWTEQRRREWERNKLARQQKAVEEKQRQIARQLPAVKRDKWYRLLLGELSLTERDFLKLLERGFTPEQIVKDGYKSVRKWQKLNNTFPFNLPGMLPNGVLNVAGDGILCPIRNEHGLIVSYQVRLHESIDGRYRWSTSATKKNPDGATSHLNGELPTGVYEPEDFKGNSIWLTEGTTIKPSLTRYRLGVPVVGAASGRFDGSPETSKKAIAYLSAKYQTKLLTFAVDAGDVVNCSGVPQRWQQQIEFFSSLGYECRVAWWGQISKNDCDIDELEDYSQIRFISLNEFLSIVDEQQKDKPKSQQIKPTTTSDWKEEYELKRSERAKFKFTRQADIEVSKGYLPTLSLKNLPKGIIDLKADWGNGKSFLTASLCQEWEGKIIQMAHLNAILHNTAPKYGLMHHHEAKKNNLSLTSIPTLAICDVTFAANFSPEHWAKGEPFMLIWDEICQGLKSLHTSPNLRGNLRIKARTKIEWLIRNATYIIAADRDLDDETLEYLERVRGDGKKSFAIHHTDKKGKTHKPITINNNKHKDEVLTRLINDAKDGLKLAIACENKTDLLAIELALKDAGISEESVFFAHGDNSNEPHIKPVIENIDSQYTDYSILGYTMTMGTAVSLERQHFDKVYAFFSGDVLAASDQCQMLFRYRPDCNITIWVNPRRRTLEINPENLLRNLKINIDETNKLTASIDDIERLYKQGIMPTAKGEITADDLPFIQHKLSIISRINASKANPFQSLYDLLTDAEFIINIERTDAEEPVRTDEGEIHSEQKKVIREEGDRLIASSELMDDVEFESAKINAGRLRKSERNRLAKTKLHRDTGLEITKEIVKLQRTKELVPGARMLKVLLGDDATSVAYDLVDRERNPDSGDQSFYAIRRQLLRDLGTPELITKLADGWSYTNDSPEIQEFGDRVRQRKADVKRLIGFKVSMKRTSKGNFKISNTELAGRVLDSLCVLRESTKSRKQGNVYRLNTQHWETLQAIMSHMDTQSHTPTLQGVIDKAKFEASQVANSQESSVNSHEETDMSQQSADSQWTEADWLEEHNVQDLAALLDYCQDAEMLADLRAIAPPTALKLAARRLPGEKREIIRRWVTITVA